MLDPRDQRCRVNRCGRPLGVGTHMSITGNGRANDQTISVCEEHWQAARYIVPVELPPGVVMRWLYETYRPEGVEIWLDSWRAADHERREQLERLADMDGNCS